LNEWERQRFDAILEELSAVGRIDVCQLSRRSFDDANSDDAGPAPPYLAAGFGPDDAPDRAILRLMRRLPSDVFLVFVTRSDLDSALEEWLHLMGRHIQATQHREEPKPAKGSKEALSPYFGLFRGKENPEEILASWKAIRSDGDG
jgi:hypothetical protein